MPFVSHQILPNASSQTHVCLWAAEFPVIDVCLAGDDIIEVGLASLENTIRLRFDLLEDEPDVEGSYDSQEDFGLSSSLPGQWSVRTQILPSPSLHLVDPSQSYYILLKLEGGDLLAYLKELSGKGKQICQRVAQSELMAGGIWPVFATPADIPITRVA